MTVLVTGFEPFGDNTTNASEAVARLLDGREIRDLRVESEIVPVVFAELIPRIAELIDQYQPQIVLCLGLDAGSPVLTIERVATNLIDCEVPDNAGEQPVDQAVITDGPGGYLATLPVKAMEYEMNRAAVERDIEVETLLSLSAGTYGCNAIMYAALHHVAGTSIRAGFVHVPPETIVRPETVADLIEVGLRAAMDYQQDLTTPGGAIA